jgi:hypothetical protein
MGMYSCCICDRTTESVDYVEMHLYVPEGMELDDSDDVREQTLGAHASCLCRAMNDPERYLLVRPRIASQSEADQNVRDRYRRDSVALVKLGLELRAQAEDLPETTVRLSRETAQAALESWEWDQPEDYDMWQTPSPQESMETHRSAVMGLIGNSVENCGVWHDDYVEVALSPWEIGLALDAADSADELGNTPGQPEST